MLGIPKEKGGIKLMFVADLPDFLVMEADSSQHEIRTLGALANDRQMIADFHNKIDFHGAARNRLYGRGFSKSNYTHQEVLDAKTAVFGPLYGRGPKSLAVQLYVSEVMKLKANNEAVRWPTWRSLPPEEQWKRIRLAQGYLDALWEPYPTSLQYMTDREKEVHDQGEIRTYYGRYRRWGLITEDNAKDVEHEARNFPVSSAANDTNLSIMLITYHTYSHGVVLPLLPIHDSIVGRLRRYNGWQIALGYKHFCEKLAPELLNTDMPFVYDVGIGKSWGDLVEVRE